MNTGINLDIDHFHISPFYSIISFHKVIDALQKIANEDTVPYRANYAKSLLKEVEKVPELYTGVTSKKTIYENIELIQNLLADLFPTALTNNEIKAVSLPFQNFIFNFTKRFQQIMNDAGEEFEINIRDFSNDQYYIFSCCLILNTYYGENFDLSRPLFYDIPDKNGVIRHYRIIFNGDFVELIPTENALPISEEDIKLLKKNYNNIDLWKEKFPQHSWILKGFGIINLFDVTIENTISNIKSNLLKVEQEEIDIEAIQNIFRSIYKLYDLNFGVFFINDSLYEFVDLPSRIVLASTFNLTGKKVSKEISQAAKSFFKNLENINGYFCVTDIDELYHRKEWIPYLDYLRSKNVRSFILSPIRKLDNNQAYFELTSNIPYALHTVNAQKLNDVLPLINDTFERYHNDLKNEIDAIIQREYTTIHPSVNWKFEQEARNYYFNKMSKKNSNLKEIIFEDVFPLYGESDIKNSSQFRNEAITSDVKKQLKSIKKILEITHPSDDKLLFSQRINEIGILQDKIKKNEFTTEVQIQQYIIQNIHPLFQQLRQIPTYQKTISKYFAQLHPKDQLFYIERKKYENSIQLINKNLTELIDNEQGNIQQIYPHYYERFRTDGVEHNIYIGNSITPNKIYDDIYLYNLRLWQLQIMSKMVITHQKLKPNLAFDMDITNLILVYDSFVSLKFRMDEKRFDLNTNSDIRYEILKKRLSKARVRHSNERIVQSNQLTIVYMNEKDKRDYYDYVRFLQSLGYLKPEIEEIVVENLQSITNLEALRVSVNIDFDPNDFVMKSYSDYINFLTKG